MSDDLAQHEARAQRGILEFADEIQVIRDERLYPRATAADPEGPWAAYCKERWGLTPSYVGRIILAAPILRRRSETVGLSVSAAASVATLDEPVQDAILDSTTDRDTVKRKAKASRVAAKQGLDVDAQIAAAESVPAKPKKKKRQKMRPSRFVKLLSPALSYAEDAADYANANVLTDTENDWAWVIVERLRLQCERISDRLYKPVVVRDVDEAAAELLGGWEEEVA